MSQKKVDNYRAGKYGRAKAARKERIIDKLEILAWIAICVAMVGWIGFYGTKMYFSNIIQNQVSSAMQIPMRFVWWILPVTMWLLLFSEVLGFLHIFIPRSDGNEYARLD